MYLSRIELNIENGHARRDAGDPYELHSTLSRALADPDKPDASPSHFLWRAETVRAGEMPVVLMQSSDQPRWSDIERRSPGWSRSLDTKMIDLPALAQHGARLRFRLRANPTVTRGGKRHALLGEDQQDAWLIRQGERLGFRVEASRVGNPMRIAVRKRTAGAAPVVVHAVTWDGVLAVTDPERLLVALRSGLGHAKFLGLGLLSVAHLTK